MIFDNSGSLANVKRHDYLPFGEELPAGGGGRTTQNGYTTDNVRQKFTSYERDGETGLDFAQARYFASTQGRFTSVDPLTASASTSDPQSFNRYTYALNSPTNNTDPSGMLSMSMTSACGGWCQNSDNGPQGIGGALSSGGTEETMALPQNTNPYTKTTGNPADAAVDTELKKLLTDGENGLVVGADAFSNQRNRVGKDSHYQLGDGQTLHTIHVFGDEGGNRIVGVYAPEAFSQIRYEGGKDGIVSATNPNTGEVLGFAHVAVSSPAALQKNTQTTNEAGSRLLGNIGGPGAHGQASAGNRHAHVTYYASAADRATARANKPATRTRMGDFGTKDAQHLRNFRTLIPKR